MIINPLMTLAWVVSIRMLRFSVTGIAFVLGATGYLDSTAKWNDNTNKDVALFFGSSSFHVACRKVFQVKLTEML